MLKIGYLWIVVQWLVVKPLESVELSPRAGEKEKKYDRQVKNISKQNQPAPTDSKEGPFPLLSKYVGTPAPKTKLIVGENQKMYQKVSVRMLSRKPYAKLNCLLSLS